MHVPIPNPPANPTPITLHAKGEKKLFAAVVLDLRPFSECQLVSIVDVGVEREREKKKKRERININRIQDRFVR